MASRGREASNSHSICEWVTLMDEKALNFHRPRKPEAGALMALPKRRLSHEHKETAGRSRCARLPGPGDSMISDTSKLQPGAKEVPESGAESTSGVRERPTSSSDVGRQVA